MVKAGRYHFSWNAAGLPSGVYLCKVQTEKTSNIKKVLLLK